MKTLSLINTVAISTTFALFSNAFQFQLASQYLSQDANSCCRVQLTNPGNCTGKFWSMCMTVSQTIIEGGGGFGVGDGCDPNNPWWKLAGKTPPTFEKVAVYDCNNGFVSLNFTDNCPTIAFEQVNPNYNQSCTVLDGYKDNSQCSDAAQDMTCSAVGQKYQAQHGRCGVHIEQYQKTTAMYGNNPWFSFDIHLYDNAHNQVYKNLNFTLKTGQTLTVDPKDSKLWQPFTITAPTYDYDPVPLSYGDYKWNTDTPGVGKPKWADDKKGHHIGGFDPSCACRQFDAGFAC